MPTILTRNALALAFSLCAFAASAQASPTPGPTAGSGVLKISDLPSPAPRATPGAKASAKPSPGPASSPESLPDGFRGYKLGMGIEEVKGLLQKDELLDYQGDADISLLPSRQESLIEVFGHSFVKRASFQFVDDKLYVMIFALDEGRVDHFSVYSSLSGRYGEPTAVSPSLISWDDGKVRMSLERPLSVKYLDVAAWTALNEGAAADKGMKEISREKFLGSF